MKNYILIFMLVLTLSSCSMFRDDYVGTPYEFYVYVPNRGAYNTRKSVFLPADLKKAKRNEMGNRYKFHLSKIRLDLLEDEQNHYSLQDLPDLRILYPLLKWRELCYYFP